MVSTVSAKGYVEITMTEELQKGDRVKVVQDFEDPLGLWLNCTGTIKGQHFTGFFIVTIDKVPDGVLQQPDAWFSAAELERITEE